MEIRVHSGQLEELTTPVFVITRFQGEKGFDPALELLDGYTGGQIRLLIERGEISGKFKEFTFIHTTGELIERVLVMGLGKREEFEPDKLRGVIARAARNSRRIRCNSLAVPDFSYLGLDSEQAAALVTEGIELGLYRFQKWTMNPDRRKNHLDFITFFPMGADSDVITRGARAGQRLAEHTNFTRDLVNEPANVLYPESFAKICQERAEPLGIKVTVMERAELEEKGMNLLLAVGRASSREPRMVVLEYEPAGARRHIGLVGKGITFDSGGYQVKDDSGMWRMHSDMAGAAAVLSAICCAAENALPVKVTAVLPMAENMINGSGYRPGDVILSYAGKTVEILHTDAEGRLILADALSWLTEQGVDAVVDIATLTGAVIVALGHQMAGLFSDNDELADTLIQAGRKCGETLWRLPVHDDYLAQLKSDVADIENSGGRPASSITAAMFLREFTRGIPWAHLDIAGTATMDESIFTYFKRPYHPKEGATGAGTRVLFHMLEEWAAR